MHITALYAENVKKLRAVAIKPDGTLIQITGPNDQGKSSLLDAIWYALGGADALPGEPLRRGTDHGVIRLETEKHIIVRKFTAEGGTTLEVRSHEGATFKSPQALLDDLVGSIAFDPLAFTRMKPREQFDTLRGLVDLGGIDIDALHTANKGDFTDRTEVNRRAKSLRTQADAIEVLPDLPEQLVDIETLLVEMEQASQTNTLLERRKAERETDSASIETHGRRAAEIELAVTETCGEIGQRTAATLADIDTQIRALQDRRTQAVEAGERESFEAEQKARQAAAGERAAADTLRAKVDAAEPLGEPVNVSALRERIDAGNRINTLIGFRDRRRLVEEEATSAEKESAELTAAMEGRSKKITDAIAAAKMPVEGLSLGDGVVLFNDLALDQASTAQRIRVSMAIAMGANPKLRVVIIREGSALDPTNLALIAEIAEKADFQVFVERVDTSGTVGIVMEDGAVKGAPTPVSPEPAPRKRKDKDGAPAASGTPQSASATNEPIGNASAPPGSLL
jgi:AAA domain